MKKAIENAVRLRAQGLCEYCHAPQAYYPERFQLDHIVARQHKGGSELNNLAVCCLECNRRKGPNLSGIDPKTGRRADLFHPRQQRWSDHFCWKGAILVGRTAVGRATIAVLMINRPARVEVRRTLIEEGVFPPQCDRTD